MKRSILFLLGLGLVLNLYAQPNVQPHPDLTAAMQKLTFMQGNWHGTAWVQMGPQKHAANQTESVQWHANGTVLTIDGMGTDANDPSVKVHQAFAVISYDLAQKRYRMLAFRSDGNPVDADLTVLDDGSIQWGFKHPMAGTIRYHIRLQDGKWVETGDVSRDGTTWTPFFEMSLEKK